MRTGYLAVFQNGHEGMSDEEMFLRELELAELTEPLGFDVFWSPEHHFDDYSMAPDNTQILAYLAGRTRRVLLGTGAVILPWNDPLRVAEKIIVLDHLCRGRLLFGMGRGLARMEYNAFGLDMSESRDRFNESAAMILQALESGFIEGQGPYYKQKRTELRPKPSRSFKGRTYAVAMSPDSVPVAADLKARMMMFTQHAVDKHLPGVTTYREHYAKRHGQKAPPPLVIDFTYCDRDAARAEAMARRYVAGYYLAVMRHYEFLSDHFSKVRGYEAYANAAEMLRQAGQEAALESYVNANVWGTPKQILDKLAKRREAMGDFEFVICPSFAGMPFKDAEASLRLYAKEVLPEIKTWGADDYEPVRKLEAA